MNKNAVATGWKLAYWTLFAGWIIYYYSEVGFTFKQHHLNNCNKP